jgi:hypothetical protein
MLPWPRKSVGRLEVNDRPIQFERATMERLNFMFFSVIHIQVDESCLFDFRSTIEMGMIGVP